MTYTADEVFYDSDSRVITLTGNAELAVGEVRTIEADKIEFVVSPEGEEGLTEYTVIVSSDMQESGDKDDTGDDVIEYKVKVVKEVDSVQVSNTKAITRKRQ